MDKPCTICAKEIPEMFLKNGLCGVCVNLYLILTRNWPKDQVYDAREVLRNTL